MLYLHLIEGRLDHFNRVFYRTNIHLRRGKLLQCGIQRSGFAGTGRASYQNDAIWLTCPIVPQYSLFARKTKVGKILDQNVRIENPHHQFLAKSGRHGGKTHFYFIPVIAHGLDAPILRPAFLHHIHAPEQLDAVGDGVGDRGGKLINLMQHAIDTEAHDADVAARLQMDVAGALLEGILEQPVHQRDDMLLVSVQVLVFAQLDQLLEILHADGLSRLGLAGKLHRIGEAVNFRQVAVDVEWAGQHQLDFQVEDTLQLRHPVGNERLGGGNGHSVLADLDRHDLEPLSVRLGNDIGNTAKIKLQRIDMKIGHAGTRRQPLRKEFNSHQPGGR